MIKYALSVVPVLGLLLLAQRSVPAPPEPSAFDKTVVPFLKANCLGCHTKGAASAGLELDSFLIESSMAKDPDSWKHFVARIRTGQMPPPGSPRPDPAQSKTMTAWVLEELARQERAIKPEAGRVTARRLNRAEYNNTVRDLLGVSARPADDFPQDDSGYGFDNIGDVLSLSPPLLEKYLTAAESVAREAIFGPGKVPVRLVELRSPRKDAVPPETIPAEYDRDGLTLPQSFHATYRFPADGKYLFNAVLSGLRPEGCEPMRFALWIDGKKVQQVSYLPEGVTSFPGGPFEIYGQKVTFPKMPVAAGEHWVAIAIERIYEGMPEKFGGPNPSKIVVPATTEKPFRVPPLPADATPEQIKERKEREEKFKEFREKQQRSLMGGVKIGNVEVGGPYEVRHVPTAASRTRLFTCGHTNGVHNATCAKRILGDLARRAFRRPVSAPELMPYLTLFHDSRKAGDSFNESLSTAVQAILVSPRFLFRIEQKHDAFELASRLSYFMWSSMPDETLLNLAQTGALRRPEVLKAQLERLRKDPRSGTLGSNFAGQWLELRKLESLQKDMDKFPTFDEYLRLSLRRETDLFFNEIVQNDRSILDFIDGDYTFVNEKLAKHYGMENVRGPEFRKVSLAGTNRCGVLTQGSVLMLTSYSTRTSPVLRGKWILDNLLNTPPPPPPPGVPSLEETKTADGASLRQQLEAHRSKPLCASCHAKLDPLGFGLENFDALGRWREKDGTAPVEASGTLPGGKTFVGPRELAGVLLQDKATFTRALTTKLLTYALGRGLERYDRPTVDKIADAVEKDNYRFSTLIREIALSLPFQQNQGVVAKK